MGLTANQFLFFLSILLFHQTHGSYYDYFLDDFQTKITGEVLQKLSPPCANFYNLTNFKNPEFLSIFLKLFDSSAKFPSGLEAGSLYDLGIFDECYGLEAPFEDETVHGKYCLGGIEIDIQLPAQKQSLFVEPRWKTKAASNETYVKMTVENAYCTTSFCTASDLQEIMTAIIPFNITFNELLCYSKDKVPDLSAGAITTITVLSFFGLIVVVSTIYELLLSLKDKKPPHEILLAFSALNNGKKIFKSTSNPDQLLCLNGLKAISMMWVILGHEYTFALGGIINNSDIPKFMTNKANMWVLNATLSVDTFFLVGGLVTMYTFLKSCDKGVKFNIILYYIHRYIRLTPVLAIVLLIHLYLLDNLGTGPFWYNVRSTLIDGCTEHWWSLLLYIQNLLIPIATCIPQSWYLSVDMQLFVLSPLVLLPAKFWPKSLYPILGSLIIAGMVTPFVVSYENSLPALMTTNTMADIPKYMEKYYKQTYGRFGPYVIGLLFGDIIHKIRSKSFVIRRTKKTLLISLVMWLVALTGLVASLYGGADMLTEKYDRVGSAFFNALDRNAWAFALGILIVLCVSGYGGPINTFLSLPIFQFLTKLSYTMYLTHYIVLTVRTSSLKTLQHFSDFQIMHAFWGDFMLTLVMSFVLCITFESPVITLEKYLLGGGTKSVKKPEISSDKENGNGVV